MTLASAGAGLADKTWDDKSSGIEERQFGEQRSSPSPMFRGAGEIFGTLRAPTTSGVRGPATGAIADTPVA